MNRHTWIWRKCCLLVAAVGTTASLSLAQTGTGVIPADIGKLPIDSWLTYHGSWSGQHFSTLKQINDTNVKTLTQAWLFRPPAAAEGDASPGAAARVVSGASIRSTPLLWNGVLFFSGANHVWAIDARTGQQKWHFILPSTAGGGSSIGRGIAVWQDRLFFTTNDNRLVALNLMSGKQEWEQAIRTEKLDLWTNAAPTVIKNHIIYGVGTDRFDFPAYLESRDPATGALQWQWRVTPGPGEPGFDSWPSEAAALHGGGNPWVPGTYDEEQNLYIFGTGNPQAVLDGSARRGDNLYTASIVAINPDTGKMKWAYQVSPHDTHDWDASVTPVQVNDTINGRPRKLVLVANRNSYFFAIDRETGKALKSFPMWKDQNWSLGTRPDTLQPIGNPAKEASIGGSYVRPGFFGFTNHPTPSYSPDTGLFYVSYDISHSIYYSLYEGTEPRGWAAREMDLGSTEGGIMAIDYKTGTVVWRQDAARTPTSASGTFGGIGTVFSTAGNLVFTSDGGGDMVAHNAKTGKPLWHSTAGNMNNPPISYMLDGKQYIVASQSAGLYAYALP